MKGRGRSGTSRDSNPTGLCCSSAHLEQCKPDEASSFTNPNVGPGTCAGLWSDIYSERGLLLVPYLLPEARGCQRLHPLSKPYCQRRPNLLMGCVSLARLPILWTLNLTMWLTRGLLLVTHLLDLTALTRCHPPVFFIT